MSPCQDFHKFGEALEPVIEKGGICVVGSAESCDKAKEKYGLSLTSPFAEDVGDWDDWDDGGFFGRLTLFCMLETYGI